MKINVIGLGYIGLPTAAVMANNGFEVLGVDIMPEVIETINQGKIHIEEPGLEELVNKTVKNGKFKANLRPETADAHIIAVPTPNKNDQFLSCDTAYVEAGVKSILPVLKQGDVVIIESTIAPRTTDDIVKPMIEKAGYVIGEDIFLAHCPERVLPGKIIYELENNNRIVGGITKKCATKAAEIYRVFVKGEVLETEAKTAEMSKLMENTFRDVNIALANELAKVCNKLEINVLDVIEMANKHPRVNIHNPGPGVGGHCLAIDPYFIYAKAPKESKIIKLSRDTNNSMPDFVLENVQKITNNDKTKTISCLGVTYKPNVDDLRESPALKIINDLKNKGYKLKICDPHVKNEDYVNLKTALVGTDLVLILVAHNEFKNIETSAKVFDTVNVLNNDQVINYGNLYKINK